MKKLFGIVLLLILTIISGVFADTNGIWHRAEDVRAGIFGSDEGGGNYAFSGNVGIGTTIPRGVLHVVGNYKYDAANSISNFPTNSILRSVNDRHALYATTIEGVGKDSGGLLILVGDNNSDESAITVWNYDSVVGNKEVFDIRATDGKAYFGGNVGIGTTNPSKKLEVVGDSKFSGSLDVTGSIKSGFSIYENNTIMHSYTSPKGIPTGDGFRMRYESSFFCTNCDALIFEKTDGNDINPDNGASGIAFVNTGNDGVVETSMVIKGNGNVGIGTTTPIQKLDVAGKIRMQTQTQATDAADIVATKGYVDSNGGVPTGAIMFFDLPACPTGWSELVSARGRYIVGNPAGGNLGLSVGTQLSNGENRATGGHFHYGAQGVRGISPQIDKISPQGGGGSQGFTVSNSGSDPGPSLPALVNTVAGTNAPYIQYLVCRKN